MVTLDPLHALLSLQRALDRSFDSDWLRGSTTGMGTFPPINVFQQGDDFVALVELPGVSKNDIEIQAKDRSIRLSGSKTISFQEFGERASPGARVGRVRPHDHAARTARR